MKKKYIKNLKSRGNSNCGLWSVQPICCATAEAKSMNNNEIIKKFNANNKKMTQEI